MLFYTARLPLGILITLAARRKPYGLGITIWSARQQRECRLQKAGGHTTRERTAK